MKQVYSSILAIVMILGSYSIASAQPGNTCASAIDFPVIINDCQFTVLNHTGLSNSGVIPTECQPNGFAGGDLWLTFEMPPSGEVTLRGSLNLDPPFDFLMDINMQVYTGTCGSLVEAGCDNDSGPGFYPQLTINQPAGTTIYVQLWDLGNNQFSDYDFCVNGTPTCIEPTATFSEECIGNNQYQVNVNVSNLGDATAVNIVNDAGAPAETGVGPGTYSIGPFSLGQEVEVTVEHAEDATCNVSYDATDIGLTCENILTCGSPLNQTYCYGNNDNTAFLYSSPFGSPVTITFLSGLIQNPQDKVRIYDGTDADGTPLYTGSNADLVAGIGSRTASSGSLYMEVESDIGGSCQDGSLGLGGGWEWEVDCATNSDCEGAISIVSHTGCDPSVNNGDLSGALAGDAQCAGTGGNGELWYSFTAEAATHFIRVSGGASFDPVVELWNSCGGPVAECRNDNGPGSEEYFWRSDFVEGQEYKIRVYHEGSAALNDPVISVDVFHIGEVQLRNDYCNETYSPNALLKATWPLPRCRDNAPLTYQWRFTEQPSGITYGPFEIYAYDSSLPNYLLWQFEEIELGATYDVEVRVEGFEEGVYGDWGPSCQITIEAGVQSGLQAQYNNGTFDLCDVIKAIPIQAATQYSWTFTDQDSGEEFTYTSSTYVLLLNNVSPQLNMNATYDVEVLVTVSGVESTTSLPGVISTAVPTTSINSVPVVCNSTVDIGSWGQAMNVCGAESYTFEFSKDGGVIFTQTNPTRVIIFNNAQITAGSWSIRVFATVNGVDGEYGSPCNVLFTEQMVGGPGGIVAAPDFEIDNVDAELSVYPNPIVNGSEINVIINDLDNIDQEVQVEVYDMTGKLVFGSTYGSSGTKFNQTIRLENQLTTGVYLVRTSTDGVLLDTEKLFVK